MIPLIPLQFEAFRNNEAMLVIFAVAMIFVFALLIVYIFYCITLSNTLKLVAPHLRTTSPASVWRIFIPIYNIFWQFMLVNHMADSIAAEYRRRGLNLSEERPAYQIGLWAAILGLCAIIPIPILNSLVSITSLVLWIIYWVKINGYKSELQRSGPWEQFVHLDAYAQNQGTYTANQQSNWAPAPQQNWNQPSQPNMQTPIPQAPSAEQTPPPSNPQDHSRWMPPTQ